MSYTDEIAEDGWAAEQYKDECIRRQGVMEALRIAKSRGVPDDALMTLAYEAGVGGDFCKEKT